MDDPQEKEVETTNFNENDCGCHSCASMRFLGGQPEGEEEGQVPVQGQGGGDPVTCGNGASGDGELNAEKQVNNPAEDVANFPRITQSETSLARFEDFILYGFNDSEDSSTSGFAFSSDLGRTWSDCDAIPANIGGNNGGDPTVAVNRNGIFYYGQIGFETINEVFQSVISVSTGNVNPNKTITMNPPQVVGMAAQPAVPGAFTQDKPWIAVGPDKNNPGSEALYVAWVDLPNHAIRFAKFRTGLNLAQLPSINTVANGGANFVFGPFVVVDDQGDIYVFYESTQNSNTLNINAQNREIRMAKSTDGGASFPLNVRVSAGFFEAAANAVVTCEGVSKRPAIRVSEQKVVRMFEIPQAAIGEDGTIYVIWNAGRTVGGVKMIDIFLAFSRNGGLDWQQVNLTQNERSFAFFPSVAVNRNGAHVQYNRFNDRNGGEGVGDGTFAVFMKTFTLTNGISSERMINNRFSPVPNNHILANGQFFNFDNFFASYMAEYNQVINGPDDTLLHAWGDNRNVVNGQNNPDVFFKQTDTIPIRRSHHSRRSHRSHPLRRSHR